MSDSQSSQSATSYLVKLDAKLSEIFVKKAPFTLPENVREIIVKILPWLTVVLAILFLPAILALLGIGAFLSPLAVAGGSAFSIFGMLSVVISLAAMVLDLIAIPGLFKRSAKAWKFVWYAQLLSLLSGLVTLDISSWIGSALGFVVGMYVLYQIKAKYS